MKQNWIDNLTIPILLVYWGTVGSYLFINTYCTSIYLVALISVIVWVVIYVIIQFPHLLDTPDMPRLKEVDFRTYYKDLFTLNDYQNKAKETAPENGFTDDLAWYPVLGLAGEAGEVCEKYKKLLRDLDGEMTDSYRHDIMLELGDVLWYTAILADQLGYTLEEVASHNVDKIQSRKQRNKIHGNGDNR